MLPRFVAAGIGLGIAATSAFADLIAEEPDDWDPSQGYMLWIAATGATALAVLVIWRVVRKSGGPGPEA